MNARNNSDRLCQPSTVNYNEIVNVEDVSGSGTITEPVTLQDVKDYLRLDTFQPNDDSPADLFHFDDSLITLMIIEGRKYCEQFTGMHFIPKTLEITLINGSGFMRIPGPITGSITIVDENGISVSGMEKIGTLFPKINTNVDSRCVLTYAAGYGSDCPEWAQNAIKAYVAWAYEHRGDESELIKGSNSASPDRAAAILRPYKISKSFM